MSKGLWYASLAWFVGFGFHSASAQDQISHEVKFPTGDAAWTVTVEKEQIKEGPPPVEDTNARRVRTINVVQKGDLRRDVTHWSDGSVTESWWLPKISLALMPGKAADDIRGIKMSQLGARRFDASTFSWVGAQTFRGFDTFKGKKVQRYQLESTLDDGDKASEYALIDGKTGIPLAWSNGVQNYVFSFDAEVPKEPLIIPSAFQEALKRYEAYYAPAKKAGKR